MCLYVSVRLSSSLSGSGLDLVPLIESPVPLRLLFGVFCLFSVSTRVSLGAADVEEEEVDEEEATVEEDEVVEEVEEDEAVVVVAVAILLVSGTIAFCLNTSIKEPSFLKVLVFSSLALVRTSLTFCFFFFAFRLS